MSASSDALYEHDGGNWKYVINLVASTKYSQGKEVYDANIVTAAKNASASAAKAGVRGSTTLFHDLHVAHQIRSPASSTSLLLRCTHLARSNPPREMRSSPGLTLLALTSRQRTLSRQSAGTSHSCLRLD